jgi:hypothetical protein
MIRILILFFLVWPSHAVASALDKLIADEQLSIRTFFNADDGGDEDLVQGGKATLTVEVATPRWFAGGTRIGPLDVQNVLVGPPSDFATNFSRRQKGVNWTVQHWSRDIFPLKSGAFVIPPINVDVKLPDGSGGTIKGRFITAPLKGDVVTPPEMVRIDQWVNATNFSIEQTVEGPRAELDVGDVIEITTTSRALGIPAMLHPTPSLTSIDGLAIYADAPMLEDRNNRGIMTSKRRDKFTLVVEKAGRYFIPSRDIHWWDATADTAHIETLASIEILTVGNKTQETNRLKTNAAFDWQDTLFFVTLIIIGVGFIIGYIAIRRYRAARMHHRGIQKLWLAGDKKAALALYYNQTNGNPARAQIATVYEQDLEEILQQTYQDGAHDNPISAKLVLRTLLSTRGKNVHKVSTSLTKLN